MAAAAKAASATPAASTPAVSSDQEKHFMPTVGMSRKEGLYPAMPQKAAGRMTEPPVWLPSAIGSMPEATAAADPDEEPPGVWAGLRGFAGRGRLQAGELGGDRLAEHEAAGAAHERHQRGIGLGPMAGVDRRSILGREIRGVENILDADRQPVQRRQPQYRNLGGPPRRRDIERREGADLGLVTCDGLGAAIDDGTRCDASGLHRPGEIERRQHGLAHARDERRVFHWAPGQADVA